MSLWHRLRLQRTLKREAAKASASALMLDDLTTSAVSAILGRRVPY
jgi:hypothetical protein